MRGLSAKRVGLGAFTIIKSLAKGFHRDYHETSLNQRVAIAMCPEPQAMARTLGGELLSPEGLFVSRSPEGRWERPRPFGQVVSLWAFADLALVEKRYKEREPLLNFAHPALPDILSAGGRHGRAPVYAGEVTWERGRWRVTDSRFRTAEAMFLASALFNRSQLDPFIPLERLLSRLREDLNGMRGREAAGNKKKG